MYTPNIALSKGNEVPSLAAGGHRWVLKADNKASRKSVHDILEMMEHGWRYFDTARLYGSGASERALGAAIQKARTKGICGRDDIIVSTKVWRRHGTYEGVKESVNASLEEMQLDYVDMCHIHWPKSKLVVGWEMMDGALAWPYEENEEGYDQDKVTEESNEKNNKEMFRAFAQLQNEGKIRTVGVSNCTIEHLQQYQNYAEEYGIAIETNQIEIHPYLQQEELVHYCKENNIQVTAYSPIGRKNSLEDPTIDAMARKHGVTAGQVILRWHYERGIIPIVRMDNTNEIQENMNIFSFKLQQQDMDAIQKLDKNTSIQSRKDYWFTEQHMKMQD